MEPADANCQAPQPWSQAQRSKNSAPPRRARSGRARDRAGGHRRGRGDRRAAGGRAAAASQAAIEARAVVAGKAPGATRRGTPGWRVVAAIGPYNEAVTGSVSAGSATDAWSVWTGTAFTAVERLKGTGWSRVPLPATLTGYARSAVAFGGDSATDFWLFNSRSPTRVLRFDGAKWAVAPIPGWVLQRRSGGGAPSVSAAVFARRRLGLRPRRRRLRRPLRRPRVGEDATARAPDAVSAVAPTTSGPCTETWPGTGTARTGPRQDSG